jgi:hypothetical protein
MKILNVLTLLVLSLPTFASGQMGLGVMLGNPTGLNGKYWLDNNRAVDAGLAYSFGKNSDLSLHSDYLFHKDEAFYLNDTHPLDLYYGIGGRMEFADDIEIGVRVPVGLAHKVNGGAADVFGEVAPIVDLFTKTGLELHFAIGARYYF